MWQVSPGALGPTRLSTETMVAVKGSLGLYVLRGGSLALSRWSGATETLLLLACWTDMQSTLLACLGRTEQLLSQANVPPPTQDLLPKLTLLLPLIPELLAPPSEPKTGAETATRDAAAAVAMAGQEGGEVRRAGEGRVDLKKERSLAEGTRV